MKIDLLDGGEERYPLYFGGCRGWGGTQAKREGCEKRNKSVTSICNSRCDVRMLAGAHQLCTVTLMDAGERPDFLLQMLVCEDLSVVVVPFMNPLLRA